MYADLVYFRVKNGIRMYVSIKHVFLLLSKSVFLDKIKWYMYLYIMYVCVLANAFVGKNG